MTEGARERCDAVLEEIDDIVDDAVRGAMYYDGDDHGDVYFREDVDAAYTREAKQQAIEDFVLEAIGDPERLEDIYEMGELAATVRWFEEAFFVHAPLTEQAGFSISFDREAASALEAILHAVEAER